ncbi:MAG: heavy-metal-associated domain-containing protein [Proteobacteria bacterium]|nr:heavy-metal-associated domain-containing protein [Pseudomonadota bacterium]
MTEAKTEVWKVEGMTCGGCAASVERVLTGAPGLSDVQVDHAGDAVTMTLDGSANRDDLARRIEGAGFDVVARG